MTREALAEQLGIEPMAQEIAERDMVKIQKVYFGAVIQIGNKKRDNKYSPDHSIRIRGYPPFKRSFATRPNRLLVSYVDITKC